VAVDRPDVLSPLKDRELYDPLAEVTRAERKLLLLVSLICLALTWSDLLPTKVEALGIEISTADRRNLVMLLGLTLLYFIVAFVTYAAADLAQWRVVRNLAQRRSSEAVAPIAAMAKEMSSATPDNEKLSLMSYVTSDVALGQSSLRRIRFRTWFESVVPLAVATVAAISVVAELTGFDDPTNLVLFTWHAAPIAVTLVGTLLLLLTLSVVRRHRGPRYKLPWRMRLAHKVIGLAKLFPFSKKLQQLFLRLGLQLFKAPKDTGTAG
jgi:ABC-type multidrug transport system fused ATPase/permease subunit